MRSGPASLIILASLAFQGTVAVASIERLAWPFVNYPMYSAPHHQGEAINRYVLVGRFDDGTTAVIHPNELGLSFWEWLDGPVRAIRHQAFDGSDRKQLEALRQLYQGRYGRRLAGLRLENHALLLERQGAIPQPPRVLNEMTFDNFGRGGA